MITDTHFWMMGAAWCMLFAAFIWTQVQLNKARANAKGWMQSCEAYQRSCASLVSQRDTLRSSLEGVTKHRDQLAGHLHDIGARKTWARQQINDRLTADRNGNVQLFCQRCQIGVGDTQDVKSGDVSECPRCGNTAFMRSWEFELEESA